VSTRKKNEIPLMDENAGIREGSALDTSLELVGALWRYRNGAGGRFNIFLHFNID
jgi:hypothetical protein